MAVLAFLVAVTVYGLAEVLIGFVIFFPNSWYNDKDKQREMMSRLLYMNLLGDALNSVNV